MERIFRMAEYYPQRIAYQVGEEKISYEDLYSQAMYYATLLRKQGVEPVILFGHKQVFMVVGILACLLARRSYVPLEEDIPIYRLEKIIEQTKASLILAEQKPMLGIDSEVDICSLKELEQFEKRIEKECQSDIAYIMFTSGSTGEPKGVPISRQNLTNFIDWISCLAPLSGYAPAKVLNQASFSFDLSVADFYYSLCNGHSLIAHDGKWLEDFGDWVEQMKKLDVELVVCTPSFAKLCLLHKNWNEKNYPSLKCIYFCGEKLEAKLVERLWQSFPKLTIINAYGPTEATSAIAATVIQPDMLLEGDLPVGDMSKLACRVEIIDDEIILKGKSVFSGYLQGGTTETFIENGECCYKTGDYGYIKNGMLYLSGRKDNQVKWKGYRVELEGMEKELMQIEGIREASVIAKKTEGGLVKTIKAFVVKNSDISVKYIKEELSKRSPSYLIPKSIVFLEKLPLTENGKVDRKELEKNGCY